MIDEIFNLFNLTILLLVLGDIVVERSGVLNLAIDGATTLLIAISFILIQHYGITTSLLIGIAISILLALTISLLINLFHLSHILAGLSMNIALYGLSSYIGLQYQMGTSLGKTIILNWWHIAIIAIASTAAVWLLLYRMRMGTAIRACGYNPYAADHMGIRIWLYRTVALIIGYIIIFFGSCTYTIYRSSWRAYSGMGYGFIALALAMASLWNPLIAFPIALFFGYLYRSLYSLQILYGIPSSILDMTPFIASIAMISIVMATPIGKKLGIPRALGEVYFKEERAV